MLPLRGCNWSENAVYCHREKNTTPGSARLDCLPHPPRENETRLHFAQVLHHPQRVLRVCYITGHQVPVVKYNVDESDQISHTVCVVNGIYVDRLEVCVTWLVTHAVIVKTNVCG